MSTLGERLRQEREKHGWSQVFVAKKLGLKRSSTYANWEYDLREPDLEMINKMAELYEVDANFLTGMTGYTKPYLLNDDKALEKQMKIAEDIYNLPESKRKILLDLLEVLKEEQDTTEK